MLFRLFLTVVLISMLVSACSIDENQDSRPSSTKRGKSRGTRYRKSDTAISSNTTTGTGDNTKDGAERPADGFGNSFKDLIGQPERSLNEAIDLYVGNKDHPNADELVKGAALACDEKHRDYDAGEVLLTQAIKLEPNNAEAYYQRGRARCCTLNLKDEEALSDFKKALELGLVRAELHEYRARLYDGRHQPEKAIAELDQAIKIRPKQMTYYRNRATLYLGIDKKEEAKKDYDAALKLDPRDSYVYLLRGQLLESMNRNEEALRDYQNASDRKNQDGRFNKRMIALKGQAELLDRMGRYKEAIQVLNDAGKDEESDEEVIALRGRCYAKLGQNELAIKEYSKAIDSAPTFSWQAYLDRSKAYDAIGKHKLAEIDRQESKRLQAEPAEKGLYSPPK